MSDGVKQYPDEMYLAPSPSAMGDMWQRALGKKPWGVKYIRADLVPTQAPDTYEAILNDELKRRTIVPSKAHDVEPPLSVRDQVKLAFEAAYNVGWLLEKKIRPDTEALTDAFLAARKEKPL